MRDGDFVPPPTTMEQRYRALQARHEQIMLAVQRWNAEARGLGYEGVADMLSAFRQNQPNSLDPKQ